MAITRETKTSPEMEHRLEVEDGLKILGRKKNFNTASIMDITDAAKAGSYDKIAKAMEVAAKASRIVPDTETEPYRKVMKAASEIVNKKESYPEKSEKLKFEFEDLENEKYKKKIQEAVESGEYSQKALIDYTENVALAASRTEKSRLEESFYHTAQMHRNLVEDVKDPDRGRFGYAFETVNNSRAMGFTRSYTTPLVTALLGEEYGQAYKRASELVAAHEPTGAMDELVQMAAQNADQLAASTAIMAGGAALSTTGVGSAIGPGIIMSGASMAAAVYSGAGMGTETYLDLREAGVDKNAAMLGGTITGTIGGAIEIYLTSAIAKPLGATVAPAARIANLYGIGSKKALSAANREVLEKAMGRKVVETAKAMSGSKQRLAAKSLLIDNLKEIMKRPGTIETITSLSRDLTVTGLGGGLEEFTQELLEMAIQETIRQNADVASYLPRKEDGSVDQKAIVKQLASATAGGILLEGVMGGAVPMLMLRGRLKSNREFNKVLGDVRSYVDTLGIKYNGENISTSNMSDSVRDMIARELLFESINAGEKARKEGNTGNLDQIQKDVIKKVLSEVRNEPLAYIIADNSTMQLKKLHDDGSVVISIAGKDHLLRSGDLVKTDNKYKTGRYIPNENGMPVIELAGPFQQLYGHESGHAVLGVLDLATKKKIVDAVADAKGLETALEAEEALADEFAELINPEARPTIKMFLNDMTKGVRRKYKDQTKRIVQEMAMGYLGQDMDFSFLEPKSAVTGENIEPIAEEDINRGSQNQEEKSTSQEPEYDEMPGLEEFYKITQLNRVPPQADTEQQGEPKPRTSDMPESNNRMQKPEQRKRLTQKNFVSPNRKPRKSTGSLTLQEKVNRRFVGLTGRPDPQTGQTLTVDSAMAKAAAANKYINEVSQGRRKLGDDKVMRKYGVPVPVIAYINQQLKKGGTSQQETVNVPADIKVVSGGQSGVDIAGLDAALEAGLKTGGTAAAKFTRENDSGQKFNDYSQAEKYGLVEGKSIIRSGRYGTYSDVYHDRTIKNAQEADGTIWFGDKTSPGGRLTLGQQAQKNKPQPLINPKSVQDIHQWMDKNNINTVNIAGNREKSNPGIYKNVKTLLTQAFKTYNKSAVSTATIVPTQEGEVNVMSGPQGRHMNSDGIKPGDAGWLGNPFKWSGNGGSGTVEQAISKFRDAFYKKLSTDSQFKAAVDGLKGKKLGYYRPESPNHASVIAEYLNRNNKKPVSKAKFFSAPAATRYAQAESDMDRMTKERSWTGKDDKRVWDAAAQGREEYPAEIRRDRTHVPTKRAKAERELELAVESGAVERQYAEAQRGHKNATEKRLSWSRKLNEDQGFDKLHPDKMTDMEGQMKQSLNTLYEMARNMDDADFDKITAEQISPDHSEQFFPDNSFETTKQAYRRYARMKREYVDLAHVRKMAEYGRWASNQIEDMYQSYRDPPALAPKKREQPGGFAKSVVKHTRKPPKSAESSTVVSEGLDVLTSKLGESNAAFMYDRDLAKMNEDMGPDNPATRAMPVYDTERMQDIGLAGSDEIHVASETGTRRLKVVFPNNEELYFDTFFSMLDKLIPRTGNRLIDIVINGIVTEQARQSIDQFDTTGRLKSVSDLKIGGSTYYSGAVKHLEAALGPAWALKLEWGQMLYNLSQSLEKLGIVEDMAGNEIDLNSVTSAIEKELNSVASEMSAAAKSYEPKYSGWSNNRSVLSLYRAVDQMEGWKVQAYSSQYIREGINRFFEDRGFERRPPDADPSEDLRHEAWDVRSKLREDTDNPEYNNDQDDAESGIKGFSFADAAGMRAVYGIDLTAEGLQERVSRILTERLYDEDSVYNLPKGNRHPTTAVMGLINAPYDSRSKVRMFHADDIRFEMANVLDEVLEWAKNARKCDASQREALELASIEDINRALEYCRHERGVNRATHLIRKELTGQATPEVVETNPLDVYVSARQISRKLESGELTTSHPEVKAIVDEFADLYLSQDPNEDVRFKTTSLEKAAQRAAMYEQTQKLFGGRDLATMDNDIRIKELRDDLLRDVFMVQPDEKLRSIVSDMIKTGAKKAAAVTSTLGVTKQIKFELTGTEKLARYNDIMGASIFAAEALSENETTIGHIEEAIDHFLSSPEAASPKNAGKRRTIQRYKELMPVARDIVSGKQGIEGRMREFITGKYKENNSGFNSRFRLSRFTDSPILDIYVPRLYLRDKFEGESGLFNARSPVAEDVIYVKADEVPGPPGSRQFVKRKTDGPPGPPGSGRFVKRKLTLPESLALGHTFKSDNLFELLETAQDQAINYIADKTWVQQSLDNGFLRDTPGVGFTQLDSPRAVSFQFEFEGQRFNTFGQALEYKKWLYSKSSRQDKARFKDKDIKLEKSLLYAPDDFAKRFNRITANSKIRENQYLSQILAASSSLKAIKIAWGMFHRRAFIWSSLFGGAIPGRSKDYNASFLRRALGYDLRREHGLKAIKQHNFLLLSMGVHGMTLFKSQDIARKSYGFNKKIAPVIAKSGTLSTVSRWTQRMQHELFSVFGSSLKASTALNDYYILFDKHKTQIENEKTASEETSKLSTAAQTYLDMYGVLPDGVDVRYSKTEEKILSSVAGLVNADFGGENLGRLGVSPTQMDVARLLLLGPDWTISNTRSFMKGLWHRDSEISGAGGWVSGNNLERKLYSTFWMRVMGRSLLLTAVINSLMSPFDEREPNERLQDAFRAGGFKWLMADITPLMRAFGETDSDFYLNTFGQFIDPFKYVTNPPESFYHKMAPLSKAGVDLWTGTRWDKKRAVPLSQVPEKGLYAYSDRTGTTQPDELASYAIWHLIDMMPIQVKNRLDLITGDSNKVKSILESVGIDIKQEWK
jgi:hypothetical protein